MQELRLVAMSEDGRYLVLATAGRDTRFMLPIDDRLRAAVRGQLSRLGQYEIEVESSLRPKEIQARIRAGETAEEVAETAGIPIDRVRWFEGPVLQEREFMAQQAQRALVRRAGDSAPGPALGTVVEERLRGRSVDPNEAQWDSWKREDGTWRVRLTFEAATRPYEAEWIFNPQRRHVSPADEDAARLSTLDDAVAEGEDTVTPLVPRRSRAPEPEPRPEPAPQAQPEPAPQRQPEPQPSEPAQQAKPQPRAQPQEVEQPGEVAAESQPEVAAEGSGSTVTPAPAAAQSAEEDQSQQHPKPRSRKSGSGRGRRASVPSWDEIMFGARKED